MTVLDVILEPKSREQLGGLPLAEIALHVAATMFHVGSLALAFAARISDAPAWRPDLVSPFTMVLIAVSALAAVHHVVLVACGAGLPGCIRIGRSMRGFGAAVERRQSRRQARARGR